MKITAESVFNMRRRDVLKFLGIAAAAVPAALMDPAALFAAEAGPVSSSAAGQTPLIPTSQSAFSGYANFYEFGPGKGDPERNANAFSPANWTLRVDGLVKRPLTLPLKEVMEVFKPEERICRMRCVEGWSMVIPWQGFALSRLLALAEPKDSARYAAFISIADPAQMPAVRQKSFPFPYLEGLRLDEAMHPLALLATGAYNKPLAPQNGAPLRLVVPWKYGFKSIKSLIAITLTDKEPPTTWNRYSPEEYGFYANVNPKVPHPRWPQANETLFGLGGLNDSARQATLLFNGYDEVAPLYAGMDLAKQY